MNCLYKDQQFYLVSGHRDISLYSINSFAQMIIRVYMLVSCLMFGQFIIILPMKIEARTGDHH
jgi:hypothetical protein